MASNASGDGPGPTTDAVAAADCAACACAYAILIKRRKATASGFGRRDTGHAWWHWLIVSANCGLSQPTMWHIEGATCAPLDQWTTVGHMSPLCLLISSYCCLASTSVRHKLNFAASAVLDGPQWLPHVVACHWLLLQDNGRAASTLPCSTSFSFWRCCVNYNLQIYALHCLIGLKRQQEYSEYSKYLSECWKE